MIEDDVSGVAYWHGVEWQQNETSLLSTA